MYLVTRLERPVSDISLQNKIEAEIQILINIIEREKQNPSSYTTVALLAYEHGLKALMEVYEVSQQVEVAPF
ncbi:hypothetical protein [Bacillus paramycoides]|uniref:hypothetical protein n=1 Tax=Bacillus paramycoides TaxID=2026194 RepID=UPI003CFD9865